jgi:hypothetical protein
LHRTYSFHFPPTFSLFVFFSLCLQRLFLLLAAADSTVVIATLNTLAALVHRTHQTLPRWPGSEVLAPRLGEMVTSCWAASGDASTPNLAACAGADAPAAPRPVLRHEFYRSAPGAEATTGPAAVLQAAPTGDRCVVEVPTVEITHGEEADVMRRLVTEYNVPGNFKGVLLFKVGCLVIDFSACVPHFFA